MHGTKLKLLSSNKIILAVSLEHVSYDIDTLSEQNEGAC